MPIEEYAFGPEQEIKTLKAALAAAKQRIANAARQADHDAGVIADLGAKMEAAEARAERAEAALREIADGLDGWLDDDGLGRVTLAEGFTCTVHHVVAVQDAARAALRGGEAQP